jgi:CRP-like cAMP-binding protein
MRAQPIPCVEDRILFNQGEDPEGLFILHSGEAVLIMHAASGSVVMCLHASGGSLLGLPGVVAKEPYTMTAMVRGGSEVGFVTRKDFEELLSAEPQLYPGVLQILAAEVRIARRTLADI